jgi:pimeloyl-ACP methyl ester carboxylesterase
LDSIPVVWRSRDSRSNFAWSLDLLPLDNEEAMLKTKLSVLFVLAMAALANASSTSRPLTPPFIESNFFVGLQPYPMYVESFIPVHSTHRFPIILIHGGVHTGAGYVSTPDGREGWAIYLVHHGWKTYVVDWPGHGRSPMPPEFSTMSLMRVVDDNVALLKKIGPAVVLVHSLSGTVGWKLCDIAPDQVAALVAIAPAPPANIASGYATELLTRFSGHISGQYFPEDKPIWYTREAAQETFANASLFPTGVFDAYYSSLVPESPRALNDLFNKDGRGLFVDPKRFASIPKVVINGDQDPRHSRAVDERTAKFVGAEHIYLADIGMPGHGHMMMLDKNNEKIAQLIIHWLAKKGL